VIVIRPAVAPGPAEEPEEVLAAGGSGAVRWLDQGWRVAGREAGCGDYLHRNSDCMSRSPQVSFDEKRGWYNVVLGRVGVLPPPPSKGSRDPCPAARFLKKVWKHA